MKSAFFIILCFLTEGSTAQTPGAFVGTWEGKINVGVELRVVFHVKELGTGVFVSTADSPDQDSYGYKCDTTTISGNSITIEIHSLNATYNGKLVDDSTIDGTFTQGGEFQVSLKKVVTPTIRKRPQTPRPPFPYRSDDVSYQNNDKTLQYGATITIPEGKGPFPAAVLITGSGPQDRDETIVGHKLFAVLADHLSRKGFIVLRVDDRGVGKSTGLFTAATSADFANDVNSSVDYLLSRPEVDKKKLGLIGHSEGGMIAPMVASQRKDINFIVLLAGPGVPIIDLMAEQNYAIAKSSDVSPDALKEIQPLFKRVVLTIGDTEDSTTAIANTAKTLENWTVNKSIVLLEEMNLASAEQRTEYVRAMVAQLQSPWFRYFMAFKPAQYLEQLNCKVLALNGDKDIQVISQQNLPGLRAALKKSGSKNYEVKELPGLNHLFQTCNKCTVQEYGDLEETFSPVALVVISDWLKKNVQ